MIQRLSADRALLKLAAVCAAASSITTILLWGLPLLQEPNIDSAQMPDHWPYMARLWVNLGHVALALIGYVGAACLCRRRAPGFAVAGLAFLAIWAAVEASGVAVSIFAVNGIWRPALAAATPPEREAIGLLIRGWSGIWEGLFFVILGAFLLGSLWLGLAVLAMPGRLARGAAILLLAAVPLTVLIMLGGYGGAGWTDPITGSVYPLLQPVSRAWLALWLYRHATR